MEKHVLDTLKFVSYYLKIFLDSPTPVIKGKRFSHNIKFEQLLGFLL